MVHLINYVPELRGKSEIVEEPLYAANVKISLRHDGRIPSRAYLAPGHQKLPLKINGNYAEITVPDIRGYQLVVFE